eukprot:6181510-Pleurochrysis_carterae.AAC.1
MSNEVKDVLGIGTMREERKRGLTCSTLSADSSFCIEETRWGAFASFCLLKVLTATCSPETFDADRTKTLSTDRSLQIRQHAQELSTGEETHGGKRGRSREKRGLCEQRGNVRACKSIKANFESEGASKQEKGGEEKEMDPKKRC